MKMVLGQSIFKNLSLDYPHSHQKATKKRNSNVCILILTPCLFCIYERESKLMVVAFKVYDMDRDGYISNGELFIVLKMMVGNNLKDQQLQQVPTPFLTNLTLDRRQDNYGSR